MATQAQSCFPVQYSTTYPKNESSGNTFRNLVYWNTQTDIQVNAVPQTVRQRKGIESL